MNFENVLTILCKPFIGNTLRDNNEKKLYSDILRVLELFVRSNIRIQSIRTSRYLNYIDTDDVFKLSVL